VRFSGFTFRFEGCLSFRGILFVSRDAVYFLLRNEKYHHDVGLLAWRSSVRFEGIDLEFKDLMKSVSYCPTVVNFCSEVRGRGKRERERESHKEIEIFMIAANSRPC